MATIVIRDRKKNSTWPRELRYIIVILFDAAFSWPKKKGYPVRTKNLERFAAGKSMTHNRPSPFARGATFDRCIPTRPSAAARICTTPNPRRSAGTARDARRSSEGEDCRRVSRRDSRSRLFFNNSVFGVLLSYNRNRRARYFFRQIVAWTRGSGGAAGSAAVSWKKSGETEVRCCVTGCERS